MTTKFLSVAVLATVLLASCSKENKSTPINPNLSPDAATFTVENIVKPKKYVESGVVKGNGSIMINNQKVEGLILPSTDPKTNAATIKFHAGKGQHLMFAMMFGASKDWFFAAKQPGIKLYDDNGKARTGDITSDVSLWDNGTKENKKGTPESGVITSLKDKTMPQNLMKLHLDYNAKTSEFTLTLTNTSKGKKDTEGNSVETPFAPVIWAVSNVLGGKLLDAVPFFEAGKKGSKELSTLAETGNPEPLYNKIKADTGIITGFSPAVVVVYSGEKNALFEVGKKDAGIGLKELAQKGDFKMLQAALKKTAGVKGVYIAGNAPVAPNTKVSTVIKKAKGDKLAYAFMFGYSNDWFYTNNTVIDATVKGDLTAKTDLFDNGTAVDQYPGAGNHQALFGGVNEKEDKVIGKVDKTFPVPQVSDVVKVSLQ